MRIFPFILFVIAISLCQAQQMKTQVICSKDLASYPTVYYEIASKKKVNDSLYTANVFIGIKRPSSSFYCGDTLFMYALAIANHENLVKARFFTHPDPYTLINTIDLKEFELDKMREELTELKWDTDFIFNNLFGNLIINNYEANWRKQLQSGNIELGDVKQVQVTRGEANRKIYVLGGE
jgi:hypothetical protein